ncbi:MAG: hypothetical protein PHV34_16090 [Verrucomicrobiae bacterium]|nr:hypothetical protein [Verrucomicrobiae bacterium]
MKIPLFIILFAGLCAAFAEAPKPVVPEDPEFVEARRLFWSGRYEDAGKLFDIYLAAHPNHKPTRNFLLMINQARRHAKAGVEGSKQDVADTKTRLTSIPVSKLEIKDADWFSVSDHLQNLANPQKGGKAPEKYINFINMLPGNFSRKVTLDMHGLDLLHAIEYCCAQAGLRCVIDAYAVIIDLPEGKTAN